MYEKRVKMSKIAGCNVAVATGSASRCFPADWFNVNKKSLLFVICHFLCCLPVYYGSDKVNDSMTVNMCAALAIHTWAMRRAECSAFSGRIR